VKRLTLCALLLLAACTQAIPGTYVVAHPLNGEKLELRDDRTFHYEAWSDTGTIFEAEGKWERGDAGSVTTEITRVIQGELGPQSPLRPHETWKADGRSVVRATTPLRRQR
jgi:hypothetical protein